MLVLFCGLGFLRKLTTMNLVEERTKKKKLSNENKQRICELVKKAKKN
jgi:hypothetical protein